MNILNDQQLKFVNSNINGAYRLLSGPGAGKTTTLVTRIRYLLDNNVQPDSILACTFSRAMTLELINKMEKICPEIESNNLSTIHALVFRILKEEGDKRNVASGKLGYLVKTHANTAIEKFGIPEVGWADFVNYVNSAKFNAIRHNNLSRYYTDKLEANGGITNRSVSWLADAPRLLAQAHIYYDNLMLDSNAITFADMLCETEWLFEDRPTVLAKYQNRFQYVFVDEAQDTSAQAMRILTLLAKPQNNITLIGDVDQTIYEFAGATPEANMLQGFEERYPDGITLKLEVNYRSTKKIIDTTNKAINANYTPETEKYHKLIKPTEESKLGKDIEYTVHPLPQVEAEYVADKIVDLVFENDEPYNFGDVFVCARTRSQLPYLYGHLAKKKIPFVDKCGGSFWEAAHIQDLIAYMKLHVNKTNDEAFIRIYNKASVDMKQPFDIKDKTTGAVIRASGSYINHRWLGKEFLNACGGSYTEIFGVTERRYHAGMHDLRNLMNGMQKEDIKDNPAKLVDYIVTRCLAMWWRMEAGSSLDGSEDDSRIQDFSTIIDIAQQYNNVNEFIEYVDSMVKLAQESKNADDSKMVVLSTIHRLKGLERKIVFVIGVMDKILPHRSALGEAIKSEGILPFSNINTIIAERRLLFVAVSRPKELLFLSGCWNYQTKPLNKSRFIYEIGLGEEETITKALEEVLPEDI